MLLISNGIFRAGIICGVNYLCPLRYLENQFAEAASPHSRPRIDGYRRLLTSRAWLALTMTGDHSSLSLGMQLQRLWKMLWWSLIISSVAYGKNWCRCKHRQSLNEQEILETSRQFSMSNPNNVRVPARRPVNERERVCMRITFKKSFFFECKCKFCEPILMRIRIFCDPV